MRIYEWKCRNCATVVENFSNVIPPKRCDVCGYDGFGRYYGSVQLSASHFEPHFNFTVGRYVTSQRDFEAKLREAGDKQSERLGIPHNYVPVDPSDKKAVGVTDEGTYEQQKHSVDSGQQSLPARTFS